VYKLGCAQSSATAVRLKPEKPGIKGAFSVPPVAGSACGGSGGSSPHAPQRSFLPTLQNIPACGHWSLLPHAGVVVPSTTPSETMHCSATIATPASRPQPRCAASASSGSAAAK
jgi:hypothetical protein